MPADPSRAIFLSYASQDAEAARCICDTLRTGGVEVWFDADGGLEHGDEWDAKIRRQIKECVLFIPIISANTQAREEGYFRLEWDLAAERARTIASGVPFILPVVIDDTREPDALVPDRFRMVQWTRLRPSGSGGQALDISPDVLARFLKLWSHRTGLLKSRISGALGTESVSPAPASPTHRTSSRWPVFVGIGAAILVIGLGGFMAMRPPPSPPAADAAKTAPLSEVQKLVAQARFQLDKPEMARIELSAADSFCKRAAELDEGDAEVWATWSQVNTWFVYYNFDNSLVRREAARDHAARAMRLAPRSFEARLAQACYWLRGEGDDVGFTSDDKPPLYIREAERMLRELHAEKPDEPRTLLTLGIFRAWEDPAKPERFDLLERVTKIPAFAAEAWKEIGWIKFFQGDPVGAAAAAERSIASQPTWNNLWLKALLATVWLGDLDLARATLERMPVAALQEDVGLYLTYWVYAWRNEPLMALGPLERQPRDWLRMSGYIGPKALLTGKLRRMANQPELARRDFSRARELVELALATDPNNRNLLSLQAQVLHFLGEGDEARRTYQLAYDLGARGPELEGLFTSPEAILDSANRYVDSLRGRPNLTWYFTAAALRFNPEHAALRQDGRFPALLARLAADPRFSPAAAPSKPTTAVSAPEAKSVAVLPFANQSADKDNEYFSDGIAEELLTTLQKIPGLRVAARTSAWSFKGKNPTARAVGETLGMAHVVEGSVQKSGNKVKITARLSRAATNEEEWSKSFGPLELTDVFATQSEIAIAIVGELRGRLTGESATSAKAEIAAQVQAATKGGTKNPEAHQLYLQGKFFAAQFSQENFAKAVDFFRRAIEIDSSFALAWAALSRANSVRWVWGAFGSAADQVLGEARRAANRALALEPDLAEGHAASFEAQIAFEFDWRGAEASSRRALALAPSDAANICNASKFALFKGDLESAQTLSQQAVALDPVNTEVRLFLGFSLETAGKFAAAAHEYQRVMEINPAAAVVSAMLSHNAIRQGRPDEALAFAEREQESWARRTALAASRSAQKRPREAETALRELIEHHATDAAYNIAQVYGFRGEADQAFTWLERALRQRDAGIAWTKTDHFLRSLHSDPRWPCTCPTKGAVAHQSSALRARFRVRPMI